MFYKTEKSRNNGFEHKFLPKQTAILIETLILGISLISIGFVWSWTLRHIDPKLGRIMLVLIATIALYWIFTDSGRKKHRYCNKAIKDMCKWQDIWQKAGVSKNDQDINEFSSKLDFLKKHVAEANSRLECDLQKSFYSEVRRMIVKINKKTFEAPY